VLIVPDHPVRDLEPAPQAGRVTVETDNRFYQYLPPDVGNIDVLIDRAKAYKKAFIFQSVGQLEDPLDIEGMEDSVKAHNRLTHSLADRLTPFLKEPLQLAAGACQTCECCTRIDNLPCRNPDKALASLEAYGIAVSELAALCGMNYINGVNTVTHFGAFLYNDI